MPPPPRVTYDKPRDLSTSVRLAFQQTPRVVGLVLSADAGAAIGFTIVSFVGALLPIGVAWIGKLIIDAVVEAHRTGSPELRHRALEFVGAELLLMVAIALLGAAAGVLRSNLGTRLAYFIQTRILKKALSLDLSHFEDPAIYDKLQNARREASSRPLNLFTSIITIGSGVVTLLSYGALLSAVEPWTLAALVAATIPSFLVEAKFSGEAFRVFSWRAPDQRRMRYLEQLLSSDASVKEIKLFGLGGEIIARYQILFEKLFREERTLALRRAVYGFLLSTLATVVLYGSYGYFALRTIEGALSIGDMTLYITVFRNAQGALRGILRSVGSTYEDNLFMSNLFSFLELPAAAGRLAPPSGVAAGAPFAEALEGSPRPAKVEPKPLTAGLVLRNVTFRYPGAKTPALDDVSFTIAPREKLAIVGENGAGKSTLIKLVTGLLEPTSGEITLDGIRLREMDPDERFRRFGVVLQDFVRYQFTARDNVTFGSLEHAGDPARLERAAEEGGAREVVGKLPNGWETQLGRHFDGGLELSLGNWQKLAVSRAFMRGADVLILDEPTASLDAEAEHALFTRFKALTEGRIAILISHRFSTVRMADRIVVLSGGRVQEIGSHAELIAKNGRYAQLFRLQAEGYLDTAPALGRVERA